MKMSILKKSVIGAVAAMAFTSAQAETWVLSPDANSLVFGNTVNTGINEVNFLNTQNQPQGIFGAGFTYTGTSFAMNFDADLYTWDSYNSTQGYYDAFIVTVSTSDFYWNLGPSDPVLASASTFVWGGNTWTGNTLESYVTAPNTYDTISLNSGPATYYVSVVLDTKTTPFTDTAHPSWGSFHVDVTSPVPEPEIYAMMAAGLGLMGFVARRRKKSEDAVV